MVLLELAGPLDAFDSQEGQPQNQSKRQIDHLLLALVQLGGAHRHTTVKLLQMRTAVLTVPRVMSSELLAAAKSGKYQ